MTHGRVIIEMAAARLQAAVADLRLRGFSRDLLRHHNSPASQSGEMGWHEEGDEEEVKIPLKERQQGDIWSRVEKLKEGKVRGEGGNRWKSEWKEGQKGHWGDKDESWYNTKNEKRAQIGRQNSK